MNNSIPATPLKLQSGAWGVKIKSLPGQRAEIGSIVVVRTQAGKTWEAVVDRIVWQDTEVQIAETVKPRAAARQQQGCPACRRTAWRRAQLWEECDNCGTEPIYV